jgi:hypothetical protein
LIISAAPLVVKKVCCEDAAELPDSAKVWPGDKIVGLIELYRDTQALLYDMTAPGYSRRNKTEEAFNIFSKELGVA